MLACAGSRCPRLIVDSARRAWRRVQVWRQRGAPLPDVCRTPA
jgi:hypothetical protein